MVPARLGSHLLIHFDRLKENISRLKKLCPKNKILLMVKADAYGHGLSEVVDYTNTHLGVGEFGVAALGEGLTLRKNFPDKEFEIYVFSDLQFSFDEMREQYLENRLIPVIGQWEDLDIFLEDKRFSHLPLCLKFNTGMNRLGIDYKECDQVIEKLIKFKRKEIFHLMTHMANASMPMETNKRNIWQRERFQEIKEKLAQAGIKVLNSSFGNSGTIEQEYSLEETHIRPGLMVYGPTSMAPQHRQKSSWQGKVISDLNTKVLKTFEVKKGEPIGYSSIACPHDGVVAIIALGYGDGISTRFSGASLYHKGVKGKVVGRVCMDMTYVIFPLGTAIERGEIFQVWGEDSQKFSELAHETNTLPYELTIQLTARVPRIYQLD